MMTFSPNKGDGWVEAIIAVLVVLTFCILLFTDGNVPDSVVGIVGLILGFYFGNQNVKYQAKTA
jgi:membrane-bound ClpP family serine protease